MKEDYEIDHLFDPSFNEKDLIKSAKRKSYFRITGVSFLVYICVVALFILIKVQLTPYFMNKQMVAKDLYYEIYGANVYTGQWSERYKLIGSSAVAPRYKLLNGKLVNVGEISLDAPQQVITVGNSEFAQYTYSGNRVMNFFHPSVQYENYADDLSLVNDVNDGKWIEMALSFDKAYTYEQVVSMLPEDVTLQWNWVNAYSAEELKGLKASNSKHAEYPATILREQEVVGFPSISKVGEPIEKPVNDFAATLELGLSKGGAYQESFEHIYKVLTNDNTSLIDENVEIIGVVVVGNQKQLQALMNQEYIKASSFGAIIDQY